MQPELAIVPSCICVFCKGEEPTSECVQFKPCNHWQCRESLTAYIQDSLSRNISVLRCQGLGCDSAVPHRVVRQLCSEKFYLRYVELAGKHALVQLVGQGDGIL